MTRKRRYRCILLLLALNGAAAAENFPLPAELQPDVDFWVAIFSHYGTEEGVLHDNRDLAVVYESIPMPKALSRRERGRRAEARKKQIRAVLQSLATGKRDNLSAEEARVLALWPQDVSNKTLAAAAKRIRYQQGLKDRFREGLIRAGRWREYIKTEFQMLGVPNELAALPHVESSYNPAARSNVGASGIWQFTRSTGRRFLRVDHVLDERNDPFDATGAAGKLLAYNYSVTGNWPMAITAYNHGLGGVRRAMRKYGDTEYAEILRNYNGRTFGFASRNFYVAFLAAKQVDQNVEQYFPGLVVDKPTKYAVAQLPDFVSISDLSSSLGITSSNFAAHNLALQATVIQESKLLPRGLLIRVPASSVDGSITDLIDNVPAGKWQTRQLPDMFHTIARGDTLSEIADTYGTRVSTLVALNNLGSSHRIRAGQQLRLPAAGPLPSVVLASPPAAVEPAAVAQIIEEPVGVVAVVEEPTPSIMADEQIADLSGPVQAALLADPSDYSVVAVVEEPTPSIMADEQTAELPGPVQAALLADPSDYSVAADLTIEVQPLETLGHYADWLGIRTQRLRDINSLAFKTPVEFGKRIKLDVSVVDVQTFENIRIAYHQAQQDSFFRTHVIAGVTEHVIRSGESIWILALREYDVPVWLFRQYNPEIDMSNVRPGVTIHIPVLATREQS